jgi:hypothetical protein
MFPPSSLFPEVGQQAVICHRGGYRSTIRVFTDVDPALLRTPRCAAKANISAKRMEAEMVATGECEERACFLYGAAGVTVPCQPTRCAFWEERTSGCSLERVGLRPGLGERPELVRWLLAVRHALSSDRLDLPEEPLPPYNLLPLPGLRR